MNNIIRIHNLILLACLLGLLVPAQVVCPQNAVKRDDTTVAKPKAAAPQAAAADTQNPENDRVTIEHADNFRYDPNTKTYHVTGNVVFVNKDMRLHCDQADYHEDTDTAKATGHLRVTSPDSVITGDLIDADFGKKLAVVTGNVRVITQKKQNEKDGGTPAAGLDKSDKSTATLATDAANGPAAPPAASADKGKGKGDKDPEHVEDYWQRKTTITCERLEYYYEDDVKKMIATPRVKAVQEDKIVWADQAIYEDIPRLITLIGNVVLNTEKGDEMQCAKAVISVDDDWVRAENMKGMTLRKSKNEPAKPVAKPATKPAAQPAPPPAEASQPAPSAPTLAPAPPPPVNENPNG